jgi:hypothetical protein
MILGMLIGMLIWSALVSLAANTKQMAGRITIVVCLFAFLVSFLGLLGAGIQHYSS